MTAVDLPEIRVAGNLVVAGGEDLRVFEIREELVPAPGGETNEVNGGMNGNVEMVEEDFFDTGHAEVRIVPSVASGLMDAA